MKKTLITFIAASMALGAICKPISTTWTPATKVHPHGIGMRCPHCGQTWDGIPKGLAAWEVRHLKKEMAKMYALHMRLLHKGKKSS